MRDDEDPTSGRRIQVQFKTTEVPGGSRVATGGGEMNVDELSFSVPAKRKAGAVGLEDRAFAGNSRVGGRGGGSATPTSKYPSPNGVLNGNGSLDSNTIRCICSITMDDGLSIACDVCDRWCHAACFDIVLGEIPDEWKCWECSPRAVDFESAAKKQRERMEARRRQQQAVLAGESVPGTPVAEKEKRPRRAAAGEPGTTGRRRRRPSLVQPAPPAPSASVAGPSAPTPAEVPEDDLVDIEDSWATSYVHIQDDIITSDEMRHNLLRQAQQWRGVSALSSPSKIAVKSVDPSLAAHPALSPWPSSEPTSLSVRTPIYAAHATSSIPTGTLISPFTSVVTPSSVYVNDSLNGYAVMGHPKPFVHLVGAPWNVALDARMAGNESRFVRVGCRPNAVLRPVLCGEPKEGDDSGLKFGVFATQDLKENEEIVLGWEWDDGNVVHRLPAIVQDPWMFTILGDIDSPQEIAHARRQVANILRTLGSTFMTCACGAKASDCAVSVMAAFVSGELPVLDENGRSNDTTSDEDLDMTDDDVNGTVPISLRRKPKVLGVGTKRGFRTREREEGTAGWGGVEIVNGDGEEVVPVVKVTGPKEEGERRRSGRLKVNGSKHVSFLDESIPEPHHRSHTPPSEFRDLRPPDPPDNDSMDIDGQHSPEEPEEEPAKVEEEYMPPKMRKRWMRGAFEALKGKGKEDGMVVDGEKEVEVVIAVGEDVLGEAEKEAEVEKESEKAGDKGGEKAGEKEANGVAEVDGKVEKEVEAVSDVKVVEGKATIEGKPAKVVEGKKKKKGKQKEKEVIDEKMVIDVDAFVEEPKKPKKAKAKALPARLAPSTASSTRTSTPTTATPTATTPPWIKLLDGKPVYGPPRPPPPFPASPEKGVSSRVQSPSASFARMSLSSSRMPSRDGSVGSLRSTTTTPTTTTFGSKLSAKLSSSSTSGSIVETSLAATAATKMAAAVAVDQVKVQKVEDVSPPPPPSASAESTRSGELEHPPTQDESGKGPEEDRQAMDVDASIVEPKVNDASGVRKDAKVQPRRSDIHKLIDAEVAIVAADSNASESGQGNAMVVEGQSLPHPEEPPKPELQVHPPPKPESTSKQDEQQQQQHPDPESHLHPERERTPEPTNASLDQPQKVRLTLKDFAARKKKQREEEKDHVEEGVSSNGDAGAKDGKNGEPSVAMSPTSPSIALMSPPSVPPLTQNGGVTKEIKKELVMQAGLGSMVIDVDEIMTPANNGGIDDGEIPGLTLSPSRTISPRGSISSPVATISVPTSMLMNTPSSTEKRRESVSSASWKSPPTTTTSSRVQPPSFTGITAKSARNHPPSPFYAQAPPPSSSSASSSPTFTHQQRAPQPRSGSSVASSSGSVWPPPPSATESIQVPDDDVDAVSLGDSDEENASIVSSSGAGAVPSSRQHHAPPPRSASSLSMSQPDAKKPPTGPRSIVGSRPISAVTPRARPDAKKPPTGPRSIVGSSRPISASGSAESQTAVPSRVNATKKLPTGPAHLINPPRFVPSPAVEPAPARGQWPPVAQRPRNPEAHVAHPAGYMRSPTPTSPPHPLPPPHSAPAAHRLTASPSYPRYEIPTAPRNRGFSASGPSRYPAQHSPAPVSHSHVPPVGGYGSVSVTDDEYRQWQQQQFHRQQQASAQMLQHERGDNPYAEEDWQRREAALLDGPTWTREVEDLRNRERIRGGYREANLARQNRAAEWREETREQQLKESRVLEEQVKRRLSEVAAGGGGSGPPKRGGMPPTMPRAFRMAQHKDGPHGGGGNGGR
ncbi:hypothetical protein D9611_012246 [Ephemerocybe angulata]|uniref:PHD-type domain-containing protein n=1 Tax=Ephemerocybe angulata TaxID=980116 RepID=A0A8H5AT03_9AGAR|nr:hypothetical protein D9611_012246 [Tulosesus angulatus]